MSRTKLYIWKAKKVKPPIHPASVYESKISDHHNHSSLEILNGTLSSERKNIKKQLYSTMDLKSSDNTTQNLCSILKPRSTIAHRKSSAHSKQVEFTCRAFRLAEPEKLTDSDAKWSRFNKERMFRDKMYECKLADCSYSDPTQAKCIAIYYVAQSKFTSPFLQECIRSKKMMASNKKEKWKSIIESAFVEPTIRDNSSFISRVNSLSTFKDMHRNASEGSIRHDNLRDKFKAVKNRLALQKDTQMTEMKKLKDTSPYSETKTFTQKISSFDKLLNSLKLSPLAKDKFNLVLDDDSCKKNLVNSFDSSDRNFTIKVHDEDHNLIEENEFDIKES